MRLYPIKATETTARKFRERKVRPVVNTMVMQTNDVVEAHDKDDQLEIKVFPSEKISWWKKVLEWMRS